MSNEQDTRSSFARDAAGVALLEYLTASGKGRGDRITAAEIIEATSFENWRSFGGRLHTWARNRGFVLIAVKNDGWRIAPASEHVDFAEDKRKRALRADKRGLKALLDAPAAELDDEQERRRTFETERAAVRIARAEADDRAIKQEFKLDARERVPLLRGDTSS